MKIIKTIAELKRELAIEKKKGQTIGFVPTMGALHNGHLSLIDISLNNTGITVVSIFVNPTQFNNKNDYQNYPVTIDSDINKLNKAGCHFLFLPSEKEIYPEADTRIFDFDGIDKVMEGQFRPGHFNGVAQVVSKLFDAVNPDKAFFGQKDFQQLAIIKKLVEKLHYPIEIVSCPIVREADGLAMSSRNVRLSDSERQKALLISKTLLSIPDLSLKNNVEEVKNIVKNTFKNDSVFKFEYIDIVDDKELKPIKKWAEPVNKVACIAVFVGETRLIDNITMK